MPPLTTADVKAQARTLGFDVCGVASAESFPELAYLREWVDRGYAGEMAWMTRTAERRRDVRAVLPGARSVIVTGTVYNVDRPYSTEIVDPATALISRYAWGDDYHDVLGARLQALLAWMRQVSAEPFEARAYVDTGPIQERVYAQYAGVGWIGKNTCVINERLGSWLFLAEILCTLSLAPDAPALDQCGTCTLCIEACPTEAIREPHVLDATRCLSYLTVELRGDLPEDQRPALGTHAYGCDLCQEVCPYNHQPVHSHDVAWHPREGLDQPRLAALWQRSDRDLWHLLSGSPMTRPKLTGVRRNLAVAIGNSGVDRDVLNEARADQPSTQDPMVIRHVEWARQQ
jgi:epoxyqueuosine reductase